MAAREVSADERASFLSALALAEPAPHEHHDHSEKLGTVAFQTSCSPAAHAVFLRGVAWLHSFEYEQAESTFNEATAADPSCAIAHWGAAMSNYHPLWALPTADELERDERPSPRLRRRARRVGVNATMSRRLGPSTKT